MTFGTRKRLVKLDLLQAHIWSAVFHPLALTSYLFAVLFYADLSIFPFSFRAKEQLMLLVFLSTCLLPLITMLLLSIFNLIPSLYLPERHSRPVPFLIMSLLYSLATYYFYFHFKVGIMISLTLLIITLALFLLTLISLFYKMSAHAVAIGGSVGILCGFQVQNPNYMLFYPVLVGFILAGFILSARLRLRAHSPDEILSGFGLAWLLAVLILSLV